MSARTPARASARPPARTGTLARTALAAVVASAVVLPLAACSGDDEPEPTPTPTPSEGGTPLEALFSEYLSEWSGEDVSRRLAEMEDLVAACMAEQGFQYTPVDYSALEIDLSAGMELEYGSADFAEQYGYGITTDPFTSGADEVTDPNQEYVAAMSDAERDAYLTALYGEGYADPTVAGAADAGDDAAATDGEEGAPLEGYDWESAGCTGRAQHEVIATGIEDDTFAALQDEMVRMMADAAADPRLAQASSDWSACMLDAGFDGLAEVGDGEAAILAEVEAARAEVYGTGAGTAPGTAPSDDPGAAAREALRRGLTDPALDAALDEALAAITPREIDMAVADAGCREDTGYDDVKRSVDTQHQLAFLADHADEIQDWMAALSADRDAED